MRRTETFTLLSGVSCTVQELTGEHEANLTSKKDAVREKALDRMLEDCIIQLGNKDQITINDARRLLDADRKHALIVIRQLSNDYDPVFKFTYEFPVRNGQREKFEYDVNFSYAVFDKDGVDMAILSTEDAEKEKVQVDHRQVNFKGRTYKKQYKNYSEIVNDLDREIKLPRCGRTVRYTLLNGEYSELYAKNYGDADDFTSHDFIYMRQPVYVDADSKGGEQLVKVDLVRMLSKDINALRASIIEEEGTFDTIMTIPHKKRPDEVKRVDLIGIPAFFFPSLAT